MKTIHNEQPDKLIPASEAAAKLGFRDAQHFYEVAAPRLGITPVRRGTRWLVWQSELDAVLLRLAAGGIGKATK